MPRHHLVTKYRQTADHTDLPFFRIGEVVDQLGKIIFQRGFTLVLEKCNDLLVVNRISAHQAEVRIVSGGIDGNSLQTTGYRMIFGFGERLGFYNIQFDHATGLRCIFPQEISNPVTVVDHGWESVQCFPGKIKVQLHWFIQSRQDVFSTFREGIEFGFRQIQTHSSNTGIDQDDERDRQNPGWQQSGTRHEHALFHIHADTPIRPFSYQSQPQSHTARTR